MYHCRFCHSALRHTFVDLGLSPLCETYIEEEKLGAPEQFYPLHTFICEGCFLVQLPLHVEAENIFSEYAYFSSFSESWLAHAKQFAEKISKQLKLTSHSLVVEVASNDGYLLQYFKARAIPVLGIEPAMNIARTAVEQGIPTVNAFFGRTLARELLNAGTQGDLIIGNNVLAHVPDINDFIAGFQLLLRPGGVITMEFPHLTKLIAGNQFDTIYHEHYSYLSLLTVEKMFAGHQLRVFDVEELVTHGGSLRIYACHATDDSKSASARLSDLRAKEEAWGISRIESYTSFARKVEATKHAIVSLLTELKRKGKSIAGYGAPGKGNTLLNYCGIRTDFLDYTVDRNPYKQGKYTPGTRIPIFPPERIRETKPDFLFILPWNLREEIVAQNSYIREWGGQFIVPIPELEVC
jgi:SAM-dependent methyltransferase